MGWIGYALLCAFAEALKDIASKQSLRSLDPVRISWVFFASTTVLTAPLLFFEPIPSVGGEYLLCLVAHGLLYGFSVYLYMRAISLSALSLTVPLIMFTPIFMLASGPLFLGEWPSYGGLLGTVLIVTGSYLLNIKNISAGLFAPFQALLKEPGARLMLGVAAIWSITSVIDKRGIQSSAPFFWAVTLYSFITVLFSIALLRGNRLQGTLTLVRSQWRTLLPLGVCNSVQTIAYVLALQSGLAVYVLSLKRTSVLMVLVLSGVIFGESRIKERLLAASIMLLGVILIALG